METKYKAVMSFVVLVVLIFGLYYFTDWFSKVTGYISGEDETTKFAQCLEERGVEFYGGRYCAQCEKQREVFGSSIGFLNYIECATNPRGEVIDTRCQNLREIPAWYINKSIYYGYKNISELRELSGCEEDRLEDYLGN